MSVAVTAVALGQWMPDAKDLKFPDLVTAFNVEPVNDVYKSFPPFGATAGPVVTGDYPHGFHVAVYSGAAYYYVGTNAGIFESVAGGNFTLRSATISSAQYDFQQYEDKEIVVPSGGVALFRTLGSASNFATLGSSVGTAPAAVRIGRIGQFIVLGNLAVANSVRWSGIDAPTNWPTPNSATAIAQQSGEQVFPSECGEVTGFSGGDQYGLVFQYSGITRMTYVGPPAVFQFDQISDKIGCEYPRSIIKIGGITYFISSSGFYKTDGVTITNIGLNRINDYFNTYSVGAKERVYAAHNQFRNLIYWSYCNTSDPDSTPSDLIIYNYMSDRFTRASEVFEAIFSTHGIGTVREIAMIGPSNTLGALNGGTTSPLGATFETGDFEPNPGGRAFVSGAKLVVDQTANAIVGYSIVRNELAQNQLATSTASTATSATGFCDFRRDARYHRLLWIVAGLFEQAQGIEVKVLPSGGR